MSSVSGGAEAVKAGSPAPTGEIGILSLTDAKVPRDITEHIQLGEHNLPKQIAYNIINIFVMINVISLAVCLVIFLFDVWLIKNGAEKLSERLLDSCVLKILIGATTVQSGSAVALIMAYLFPGKRTTSS